MIRSAALGILLAVGTITMASAQTAEDQAACQDDTFRICSHTIPDRERTFQCMIANRDALSPACRTVMARLLPPEPPAKKMAAPRNKKGPIDLSPTARR
jgi:hypothetical protein